MMKTTTLPYYSGYDVIEDLGIVMGNTIRSKNIGYDFIASIRTIFGGEIPEYTKMMFESRKEAYRRMVAEASECGADAILNVRFETSSVLPGTSEFVCSGTAVKLIKKE